MLYDIIGMIRKVVKKKKGYFSNICKIADPVIIVKICESLDYHYRERTCV